MTENNMTGREIEQIQKIGKLLSVPVYGNSLYMYVILDFELKYYSGVGSFD